MTDGPTVDGRNREALLEGLRERATNYTDDWDPYTEDAGTTLLLLFARFGTDVINRLNEVPYKHRVAFLDELGFEQRPPQAARVPLTFTTTADIDANVVVHGGAQATAEVDDETVVFEIPHDSGFEATAAALESVYSLDPGSNSIYAHEDLLEGNQPVRLFDGADVQEHELYLGEEDLLNLEAGSTVTVAVRTGDRETIAERVDWEYHGQGEDGEVGWHPLPLETPDVMADPFDDEVGIEEQMRRVSDRIQLLGGRGSAAEDEALSELAFQLPGPTEPVEVAGVESRWIRGRIPGDEPADFDVEVEAVRLDVEAGGDEMEQRRPTMVFSDDVPVSLDDGDFRPFGRMPQPPSTLYLASEEAFTKEGGAVDVEFVPPESEEGGDDEDDDGPERRITGMQGGPLGGPPELSWEYWNGNGWARLVLEGDETDAFRSSGTVSFAVPPDFEPTEVSGHDDYWIRARLVGGNYGQPEYEVTSDGTRGKLISGPEAPTFGDVTVRYGQRNASFDHVLTHNNAAYREAHQEDGEVRGPDREGPLVPFDAFPDGAQTLYFGFDGTLMDGPINLHVPMRDKAYPREFEPNVRWEYCENPESWSWRKLDVYDGTEGLTERGIVSLNFPSPTTAFELFGESRHWIRARITGDEFVTDPLRPGEDGRDPGEDDDGDENGDGNGVQVRTERDLLETNQQAEAESRTPPTLTGVHPNTQWAYNERSVDEVLGSSDGSPEQTFTCEDAPVTEADVWVDEAGSLSAAEQRELEDDRPGDVRREDGEFWVRWTEVADFLDSDDDARHYRLNRSNGQVIFGNGREGAIPPSGEGNVEVTYQTGGGSDGNVPAGSITDLRSSIAHIDEVTNRKPSDGGTDIEALEGTISRAPRQIKNRGRAVSAEDFEQIAKEASRQLATVRCEPEMDDAGRRTPGWVTLLIIPRERRDRPTPSLELRQRVRDAVSERAPTSLVGHDRARVVVRGPDYATVSVQTTVETRGVESITNLKNTIEGALNDFFHPLTGGRDGDGWEFGRAPRLSQLSTFVEETAGVDRVSEIAMTLETTTEEKIIRDPEKTPVLARDEMISSGTHEVNVVMRRQS